MFKDRTEAAEQLTEKLVPFKEDDLVVIAIPRGGLPLGSVVASALNAPLDVALTKKIGHPAHKEYAIGAVSLENRFLTDAKGISTQYIEEETTRIRELLSKRHGQYYKNSSPQMLIGKTVIIVDDGIATGNTILATIELVHKNNPEKIIVAIPVAPPSAVRKLMNSPLVEEVVCLETPYDFHAVGQFYEDFSPVSDKEAIEILETTNTSRD